MRADYLANYDQIAADHVAHWRLTGENPWQPPEHVEAVLADTLNLIVRYTQPGDRVLDVGCGMGDLLGAVDRRFGYGIDLAGEYVEIARARGLNVIRGTAEALPFGDGWFDAVVATDLLEHVLDLNAVLAECLRVLRTGGHLIIRSPNEEDLSVYLDAPYRFVHLRRFDEAGLRLLLDRVFGCDVVECRVITPAIVGDAIAPTAEISIVARKR